MKCDPNVTHKLLETIKIHEYEPKKKHANIKTNLREQRDRPSYEQCTLMLMVK
jgi:hypothetical protein